MAGYSDYRHAAVGFLVTGETQLHSGDRVEAALLLQLAQVNATLAVAEAVVQLAQVVGAGLTGLVSRR